MTAYEQSLLDVLRQRAGSAWPSRQSCVQVDPSVHDWSRRPVRRTPLPYVVGRGVSGPVDLQLPGLSVVLVEGAMVQMAPSGSWEDEAVSRRLCPLPEMPQQWCHEMRRNSYVTSTRLGLRRPNDGLSVQPRYPSPDLQHGAVGCHVLAPKFSGLSKSERTPGRQFGRAWPSARARQRPGRATPRESPARFALPLSLCLLPWSSPG